MPRLHGQPFDGKPHQDVSRDGNNKNQTSAIHFTKKCSLFKQPIQNAVA